MSVGVRLQVSKHPRAALDKRPVHDRGPAAMKYDDSIQLSSATQVGGSGVAFIQAEKLCKTFATSDGVPTTAIEGVDLQVDLLHE
jgi:hypothetical protein